MVFVLIFTGCAQFKPSTHPLLDKKAFSLATQAKAFNQHILASKGIAWARLETETKTDKFKIAWAAVFPNKIRITFIMSGLPLETILATGEKITFFSHTGKHATTSYHSKDPDMEKYLKVPVKLSEMIFVLLGRFPVKNFDAAFFSPSDPSFSSVILKQRWKGETQSLYFDDKGKIEALTAKSPAGKFLYKMRIIQYKTDGLDQIPVKIEVKDRENRKLTLEIKTFQKNPPIKESIFQLTESG